MKRKSFPYSSCFRNVFTFQVILTLVMFKTTSQCFEGSPESHFGARSDSFTLHLVWLSAVIFLKYLEQMQRIFFSSRKFSHFHVIDWRDRAQLLVQFQHYVRLLCTSHQLWPRWSGPPSFCGFLLEVCLQVKDQRPVHTRRNQHHVNLFQEISVWSLLWNQKPGPRPRLAVKREGGSSCRSWTALQRFSWPELSKKEGSTTWHGGWEKGSGLRTETPIWVSKICSICPLIITKCP